MKKSARLFAASLLAFSILFAPVVANSTVHQYAGQGPRDGQFNSWTKRIGDGSSMKFYVKYPQVGKKIQFLVQQGEDPYREAAWLRLTESDLNTSGGYRNLQNHVYFIRTVELKPGKNRFRILVDGKQVRATTTYVLTSNSTAAPSPTPSPSPSPTPSPSPSPSPTTAGEPPSAYGLVVQRTDTPNSYSATAFWSVLPDSFTYRFYECLTTNQSAAVPNAMNSLFFIPDDCTLAASTSVHTPGERNAFVTTSGSVALNVQRHILVELRASNRWGDFSRISEITQSQARPTEWVVVKLEQFGNMLKATAVVDGMQTNLTYSYRFFRCLSPQSGPSTTLPSGCTAMTVSDQTSSNFWPGASGVGYYILARVTASNLTIFTSSSNLITQ